MILAKAMGLCSGVRDALQRTREVKQPQGVSIHGELVHNRGVQEGLIERGFTIGTARSTVMITAHGVSDTERRRLEAAGKHLIDTTCSLVAMAHDAATALAAEGRHVLVIGRAGHVEVRGLVGDLGSYDVVSRPDDVCRYDHARLGVVCQTTVPSREVAAILEAIRSCNPDADVRFADTVCLPTKERQRALGELLERVEAVVVVGGANSNNTRKLVGLCEEGGLPAIHVQGPADLSPDWVNGYRMVGLTAGTSTPDEQIDAVRRKLESM